MLLDQVNGCITSRGCWSVCPMVGNGAVATFQQIRTEYLHAMVASPLGPPIREPNLSKYLYTRVQKSKKEKKACFCMIFGLRI